MTINVLCIFHAIPEHRDELKRRLDVMAAATHADEGCLLYAVQEGAEDPNLLCIVEKWASDEALARHATQPHVVDGGDERRALMSQPGIVVKTRNADDSGWPVGL